MDLFTTAKKGIRKFTDTLTGTHGPPSVISSWRIIGSSIRGASHIRTNLSNQDALNWKPENGTGTRCILAVADGHGSKKYFRSDVGARLAVETACEVCESFIRDYSGKDSGSVQDLKFRDVIGREIVRKWQERVRDHMQQNPFSQDEQNLLVRKPANETKPEGDKIRYRPPGGLEDSNYTIPYGTTLLAVIVTEKFLLYLQLGDGDIITLSQDGSLSHPLPKDERLLANETTSLCLPIAWEEFRVRYQPADSRSPILILVSSDGYSNSFTNYHDFEKVGSDILRMIINHPEEIGKGIDTVQAHLTGWLQETSEKGSGDDITVGILCDLTRIAEYSKTLKEQRTGQEGILNENGDSPAEHLSDRNEAKDGIPSIEWIN
jgi:serine/threonine protein phosphatase PrpC